MGTGPAFQADGPTVAVALAPSLRAEFGAHLEANYPRLVAQLCMITLDTAEAQDLVQDAYARAWQRWSDVREMHDPAAWVRQTAVRATDRRWRRFTSRFGRGRRPTPVSPSDDPRHAGVLDSLARIAPIRRRVLVLVDVAHLSLGEVAEVESIDMSVAESRLTQARQELDGYLSGYLAAQEASEPLAQNWEDM